MNSGLATPTEIGGLQNQYEQQYVPPTMRQRLEQQKAALESQLTKINAAIDALNAHPDLEQYVNTLQAAGV